MRIRRGAAAVEGDLVELTGGDRHRRGSLRGWRPGAAAPIGGEAEPGKHAVATRRGPRSLASAWFDAPHRPPDINRFEVSPGSGPAPSSAGKPLVRAGSGLATLGADNR